MKHDNYQTSGKINSKGELMIYNMDQLKQFCKQWRNENIVITIDVEQKSSGCQIVYFKKNIFPTLKKLFHETGNLFTDKQIYDYLYSECPFMSENEKNIDIEKMTSARLNMVIEWVKYHMAENFNFYIND